MTNELSQIIKFNPPLPCGTIGESGNPDKVCGKPATTGTAYRLSTEDNEWHIMPICKDCALAMHKLYKEQKS